MFKIVEDAPEGMDWDLHTYGNIRMNKLDVIRER